MRGPYPCRRRRCGTKKEYCLLSAGPGHPFRLISNAPQIPPFPKTSRRGRSLSLKRKNGLTRRRSRWNLYSRVSFFRGTSARLYPPTVDCNTRRLLLCRRPLPFSEPTPSNIWPPSAWTANPKTAPSCSLWSGTANCGSAPTTRSRSTRSFRSAPIWKSWPPARTTPGSVCRARRCLKTTAR